MLPRVFILIFFTLIFSSPVFGQTRENADEPNIFAIVKDPEGSILEGTLRSQSDEITVSTQDNKEKIIPSKYIKSITLEKLKGEGPAALDPNQNKYSVRVENSQEIYTLRKKYTFSLNTNVGVVTKSIDPEMVNSFFAKEASAQVKPEKEKPFIQDKSIVFSLEFKF